MTPQYHFISGLPRSGSTLLSGILSQNPRFHSSISDTLAILVKGTVEAAQEGPGMKVLVPSEKRESILKGLFTSFYYDCPKPVVFNTNRAWTYLTPLLRKLFPASKMILCVRDISWILDSFERMHRKYPLNTNTLFGGQGSSVYDRVQLMMDSKNGVVGFPYVGLKQALCSDEKDMLILVEYEMLCRKPEAVLRGIYSSLDEPWFDHDFDNIFSDWNEFDFEIGLPLHSLRQKVEFKPRQTIIPPDILQEYTNYEIWRR